MLNKFRFVFAKSVCLGTIVFNLFTGIIIFISTFIQLNFLAGKNFANFFFGFRIIPSYLSISFTLFFSFCSAVISILFFVIGDLLKFHSGLRESMSTLAVISGLIGFLTIMFSGVLDTTTIYFSYESNQILIFSFFRALDYLFYNTLYLFSIGVVYRMFYNEDE